MERIREEKKNISLYENSIQLYVPVDMVFPRGGGGGDKVFGRKKLSTNLFNYGEPAG
jgi:hypothetical protein